MNSRSASAPLRPAENSLPIRRDPAPVRVMIVDDSQVARTILSRMISSNRHFEVVAAAADAHEAMDVLATRKVDIVLLDVEMPGTSGIDVLPEIVALADGPQVLIVSSHCEDGAEATVKALALGAADTLPKPGKGTDVGRFTDILFERLRKMAREGAGPDSREQAADRRLAARPMPTEMPSCIALGASTGGLHALNDFFASLPADVDVPLLVTQHLPPAFMSFFARQIEAASGRPAKVAQTGFRLKRGEILVAPGDAHIGLRRQGDYVYIELVEAPAESGCMPSVDTMFHALANAYGPAGLGIVLTGMGRDGLAGARNLIAQGGSVFVQDRQSSAVWGMPRAVAEAELASVILHPSELALAAAAAVRGEPWK